MKALQALIGAALAALCFSAQAQDKLAETVAGAAKYQAVSDCMSQGKDSSAQVACVMSIAMIEQKQQAQPIAAPAQAPYQPVMVAVQPPQSQVQVVEQPCSGFWDCLGSGLGKGLQKVGDIVERNLGIGLQTYGNIRIATRNAESADRNSDNQLQRDQALYAAFQGTHAASVGAVRDTALGGYNTISLLPTQQTTTYTLNNAQGVQFGGGRLNYTGPVSRDCRGGQTGQAGSTVGATSPAGSSGSAAGGNC